MRWVIASSLLSLCGCSFKVSNVDWRPPDMAGPIVVARHDMAEHVVPDMAREVVRDMVRPLDLEPPADMTPLVHYRETVQAILDARGCTAATCHQAYAPLIIPNPKTTPQWTQNYDNAMADVSQNCDMATVLDCASSSLLLTKPLANNNVSHAGGVKPFTSTAEPDYQTLLIWIEEGARM